ncbi:MAG: hypothetical protein PHP44_11150, partial [Kiritimatiellae bacterium]|nr:hypothetical protein [Kiritimatiellia bacterium]
RGWIFVRVQRMEKIEGHGKPLPVLLWGCSLFPLPLHSGVTERSVTKGVLNMSQGIIREALHWMDEMDQQLLREWPKELPAENSSGFWQEAARLEMIQRKSISQKIARLISTGDPANIMSVLDQWYYRRRVEYAVQLCVGCVQRQIDPSDDLRSFLHDLLISEWEEHGCLAFWNHAIERGGVPHPENPDGTLPLAD